MNNIIIIPIAVFYASYITKAILLKKKGLNANQLGLGQKELSTRLLEYFLIIITYTIIVVQSLGVFGIFNRTQIFKYSEILGIIIALIGNVFFILALVYMKNNWRAGIDSTQKTTLTTSGIFNISRNPAFLGFDLFYIGTSLALANIFLIILTVIALILFHLQILKEEKFLTITFEDDYLTYKKKSKALYLILQKIFLTTLIIILNINYRDNIFYIFHFFFYRLSILYNKCIVIYSPTHCIKIILPYKRVVHTK